MGKFGSPQIGVFSPDGNNYDDPNLNKCANCGALFQGEICPICKTVCAPEMMAGNRKTPKKKDVKSKNDSHGCLVSILAVVMLILALSAAIASGYFPTGSIDDAGEKSKQSTEYATKEIDKTEYNDTYGYETLARFPDEYVGVKVCLSGKVLQTIEGKNGWMNMRLGVNQSSSRVVYCVYHEKMIHGRLLDDDKVIIYGVADGLYTYKAISGKEITIPLIRVDAIEFAP